MPEVKPINRIQIGPMRPQLPTAMDEGEFLSLMCGRQSVHWCAQEKYDGKRKLIEKIGGSLSAFNKQGFPTDLSMTITEAARLIPGDFLIDGEALGDRRYVAFDLLQSCGNDLSALAYGTRHKMLTATLPETRVFHVPPVIIGAESMRKLFDRLKAENTEGLVLKDLLASHVSGRSTSMFKCKFKAQCSAVVIEVNEKRSVKVALYIDDKRGIPIGNVTIPANHEVPNVGAVVEISYLYAHHGGSLDQPVYLGERDDVDAKECTVETQKLKYKREEME